MVTGSGDTHTLRSLRQEDREFKASLGYIERSRPAWVTITTTIKINGKVRSNKTDLSTYG